LAARDDDDYDDERIHRTLAYRPILMR